MSITVSEPTATVNTGRADAGGARQKLALLETEETRLLAALQSPATLGGGASWLTLKYQHNQLLAVISSSRFEVALLDCAQLTRDVDLAEAEYAEAYTAHCEVESRFKAAQAAYQASLLDLQARNSRIQELTCDLHQKQRLIAHISKRPGTSNDLGANSSGEGSGEGK